MMWHISFVIAIAFVIVIVISFRGQARRAEDHFPRRRDKGVKTRTARVQKP